MIQCRGIMGLSTQYPTDETLVETDTRAILIISERYGQGIRDHHHLSIAPQPSASVLSSRQDQICRENSALASHTF